jgi:hypothetical protein
MQQSRHPIWGKSSLVAPAFSSDLLEAPPSYALLRLTRRQAWMRARYAKACGKFPAPRSRSSASRSQLRRLHLGGRCTTVWGGNQRLDRAHLRTARNCGSFISAADARWCGATAIAPTSHSRSTRISVLVFGLRLEMKFAFCVTSRRFADGSARWRISTGKAQPVSGGLFYAPSWA